MKVIRVVIYVKDVMLITGKCERRSRALLNSIKKQFGKEKHQLVSVSEFCSYTGLDPEDIAHHLL